MQQSAGSFGSNGHNQDFSQGRMLESEPNPRYRNDGAPSRNTCQMNVGLQQVQGCRAHDLNGQSPRSVHVSQSGSGGEGRVCSEEPAVQGINRWRPDSGRFAAPPTDLPHLSSNEAVVRTLEKITSQSELPAPSPMVFDGNAADFPKFFKSFNDRVECKPFSDSYKLSQLIMCTSGEAKKAITRYEGAENGYALALGVLRQRYGRPYQIVKSCIDKLTGGPNLVISNRMALLEFADLLDSTFHSLEDQELLAEANTQSTLTDIFNRLPKVWQQKWVNKVLEWEDKGKLPKLKDMVTFVNGMSRASNHAVYRIGNTSGGSAQGKPTQSASQKDKSKQSSFGAGNAQKVTTLSTQVQEKGAKPTQPGKKCSYCDGSHQICECREFKSKNQQFRKRFVRNNGLCFCCFGRHMVKNCKLQKPCSVAGCGRMHHPLLHLENQSESAPVSSSQASKPSRRSGQVSDKKTDGERVSTKVQVGSVIASKPRKTVLLKVVPVCVKANKGTCLTTFAMLDSGSSTTMVTEAIAERLGMRGDPDTISISTVLARGEDKEVKVTHFSLTPVGASDPEIPVDRAHVVECLHVDKRYKPDTLNLQDWDHLKGLDLTTAVDVDEISVLIGENVPYAHAVLESVYGDSPHSQPYAVKTPLAWCVAGPTHEGSSHRVDVNLTIEAPKTQDAIRHQEGCCEDNISRDGVAVESDLKSLNVAVNRLWEEEKHGFTCDGRKGLSAEDQHALKLLEERTNLVDGRYCVGMLWRDEDIVLPNNRVVAERRLKSLGRRFKRDPEFAAMYRKSMEDTIAKGYAVKVTEEEAALVSRKTWYLPHHGVQHPNKPGKVRVVYDAAATYGGTSLNNELLQGPDFNNSLLGVLLRFRQGQIALQADVEAMFMQFTVPEADSEALRFLWWEEDGDVAASTYRMTRHIFGARDSPSSCTYGLQRCARDNRESFDQITVQTVEKNFYVDDLLKSITPKLTAKEATELALQLIQLLERGGMTLRSFVSNSPEVLKAIPEDHRAACCRDIEFGCGLPMERALGIVWDAETDNIGVKVADMNQPNTKRGCLAAVSSLYDPIGMVGPVTLHAKRILQLATKADIGWDEVLPESILNYWTSWKEKLSELIAVRIPRWYFPLPVWRSTGQLELHHFADASESGYGTVSYLRKVLEDRSAECSFIMAKGRTAPSNFVSVPRLELQAAVVASRVDRVIRQELELDFNRVVFWTDSKLVLQYIQNQTRRFKTYVANRVTEIRDASSPDQWRHVPGRHNPADEISRGQTVAAFLKNERWFQGPEFLRRPEEAWPSSEIEQLSDTDAELKEEKIVALIAEEPSISQLMKRYSSWTTLLRKIAYLMKYCRYVSMKAKGEKPLQADFKVTVEDLKGAREKIVKYVQKVAYQKEIADIVKTGKVDSRSSLKSLDPTLIDGILRVGGRIGKAPVSFDAKHPLIIPKNHPVAELIVQSYHTKFAHAGQEHVLADMRQSFWIPQARSLVRKVIRNCLQCRKQHARTMRQKMAGLPAARLTPYEPPFKRTGVDYFGPLLVKRARSTIKRWGALFTCLNSRAIHIEVAESLDTSSFINALRRFVGRRGNPSDMWSDNGTNFVGGERELKESLAEWNQDQIEEELKQKGIRWHFQPPGAPHMSGVWERLVKSVKGSLKAILGESLVSDEVLVTVLVEVESILNSRPLCKSSEDPRDEGVLTPNHLLLQRGAITLPPGTFVDRDIYKTQACKRWRQVQILAQHFWRRWLKEYLPALQERMKWRDIQREVKVGDLVLVAEETSRGKWPLGKITRTFPGDDGLTRVVEVKTQNSVLKRPVNKLCLLEGSE